MIRDIEGARPTYLLVVNLSTSWSFQPNSPHDILNWLGPYTQGRYALEGVVKIYREGSVAKWGADARAEPISSSDWYVGVWRRVDSREAPSK